MESLLSSLYYQLDNPSAYTGISNPYREARRILPGIIVGEVKKWLEKQYTYSVHKPVKKHFPHTKYIFHDMDEQWQLDLADMTSIAEHNDGFKFLLTCTDGFSKYAWAKSVRANSGAEIVSAFQSIVNTVRKPVNY